MSCGRDNQESCRCSIENGTSISVAVIECIAEADGGDLETRPPLYEAIDPEALDNLFRNRTDGEVTFSYLDYEITVTSDTVTTTRQCEDPLVSAD